MNEELPQNPSSAPEGGSSGHQHGHSHLPKFTFLEELKRRNVGRVAILYIILGYVVLETFGVFVHLLDLPPWVGRSAVLLVAVGFPVALLIAWIYEITPEGLKPTDEVAPHQSIRHLTGRRLDRAIIAVLAVALSYFVIDKFWLSNHGAMATSEHSTPIVATASGKPAAALPEKSVAVLPFSDMSEKHDQEYFSDGLSEELIDMLVKIPDLHVPARTSSFYFKGRQATIKEIGAALGVAHVLEGSVRKSGNMLRITAQLIRVDTGYHVWSQTYDRKLDDIFKVQDEIASEVARALSVSLQANGAQHNAPAKNSETHALLLQAWFLVNRWTPDDMAKAISYYHQVLQLDPKSAPAWAGLSRALIWTWTSGWLSTDRSMQQQRDQALQAAERAIAADPNLSEAHQAMAELRYWFDWDWVAARDEVDKALALDPASSDALVESCVMAALSGQLGEAVRRCEDANARDPLSTDPYFNLAALRYLMNQLTQAEADARKGVALAPTAARSHVYLAAILLAQGNQEAAIAEIEKDSDESYRLYALSRTYFLVGRKSKADATLAEFEKNYAANQPYLLATLHALRGELDQAFLWLDRAYKQRDPSLISVPAITLERDLRNLRGDPRYKTLLRRMNLQEQ